MSSPFEVYEYSIEKLQQILAEKSKASSETIREKLHTFYFDNYFAGVGAKTILVENDYVDKDYLDDYSNYYVKCFKRYKRKCTRLHFFSKSFSANDFEAILESEDVTNGFKKDIQTAYLGFVVVKPLPKTIIGRTCLKTYEGQNTRFFPVLRPYGANIFGLDVKVNTLAFQEQDSVVAACATSALWSVFHGTGKLFQHHIPSPVEITKIATDDFPIEDRAIPSRGLNIAQMAFVVRHVGLEPVLIRIENQHIFKAAVYAYLKGAIPSILGMRLVDTCESEPQFMGKHAVAVTGYSLGLKDPVPLANSGFLLRASRMDKLYVHDDQVGPFAKMIFDGEKIKLKGGEFSSLSTSWRGINGRGDIGCGKAIGDILLVPVYHKIRIPFCAIHDQVLSFDAFLKWISQVLGKEYENLEWDIYFSTINDFKSSILNNCHLPGNQKKEILLASMPRYIWRATGFKDNRPVIGLVFDATDIEQGRYFIRAVEYDERLALIIKEATKHLFKTDHKELISKSPILQWFCDNSS